MYGSYNGGVYTAPKRRVEPKVSFVFRRTVEEQHCAGINAIKLGDDDSVYTASRDSTVRRWHEAADGSYVSDAQYGGHLDWVNDIVLHRNLLATCSSDRMVNLWDTSTPGPQQPIATFNGHKDYVTSLATAPAKELLASAGLSGEVFLWDIATATQLIAQGGGYNPVQMQGVKESVYSVAMNEEATVVAAGTTGRVVRIADPRTGDKVMKLRGHTDNIRALLLNASGTLMLSGSSDHSVRLWDLGQQRCVHTFVVHTDSVWALAASPGFGVVYSGGKDKRVYRTNTVSRRCELLLEECSPVLDIALRGGCCSAMGEAAGSGGAGGEDGGKAAEELWVATTSSTATRWRIEPDLCPSPTLPIRVDEYAGPTHSFLAGASTLHRARQVFETGSAPAPQQSAPCASIPGLPPLVRLKVLADRRHVLTQDSEACLALWDIASGGVVEEYGPGDFEEKEADLFRPMSVASWMSLDTKLGCLAGHLETPQCFCAEIYAQDLGIGEAADDVKLNFGERMLRGLFARWADAQHMMHPEEEELQRQQQQMEQQQQQQTVGMQPSGEEEAEGGTLLAAHDEQQQGGQAQPMVQHDGQGGGGVQQPAGARDGQEEEEGNAAASASARGNGEPAHLSGHEEQQQQRAGDAPPEPGGGPSGGPGGWQHGGQGQPGAGPALGGPFQFCSNPIPPALMMRTADGLPWRRLVTDLTGGEPLGDVIPAWVADCVLAGKFPLAKELKTAFVLQPVEGSNLPSLLQSRLNAPRVLRIHKVVSYAISKLAENNIVLAPHPVHVTPPQQQRLSSSGSQQGQQEAGEGGGGGAMDLGDEAPGTTGQQPALELLCNNMAVPYEMSLAAVRQYVWKRQEDLLLHYRIRDPRSPAPLPVIKRPAS